MARSRSKLEQHDGVGGRLAARIARADFRAIERALDLDGAAVLPGILGGAECKRLAAMYDDDALFRSTVVMAHHGYGKGEYKYFAYPLPEPVAFLRDRLYQALMPIANRWNAALGESSRYPETHARYVELCHAAGQTRPTPLLLRYGEGDYNCLHQDLYGDLVFPLQVAFLLSDPENDFTGGEFVMTEQRPRMQSRPLVVPLTQGDAVVFAVRHRPVQGLRGVYRMNLRHGVSRVRSGRRLTAGIIFHDAR